MNREVRQDSHAYWPRLGTEQKETGWEDMIFRRKEGTDATSIAGSM